MTLQPLDADVVGHVALLREDVPSTPYEVRRIEGWFELCNDVASPFVGAGYPMRRIVQEVEELWSGGRCPLRPCVEIFFKQGAIRPHLEVATTVCHRSLDHLIPDQKTHVTRIGSGETISDTPGGRRVRRSEIRRVRPTHHHAFPLQDADELFEIFLRKC